MSKKIQLSIPKPCHENWDAMTQVEKGKFCGSCQKQVVDFSSMSDRQVAEFFKKPSTGSVCGRFMTDQLDRDIEIPKKRIPWLKYFFTILLPAIFLSKASAQKTIGKVAASRDMDTTRVPAIEDLRILGMVLPNEIKPVVGDTVCTPINEVKGQTVPLITIDTISLKGKVTDENGIPVAGASVTIKGTRIGVASDINGQFKLKSKIGDVLVVTGVGFESEEIIVENREEIVLKINRYQDIVGEVIIVGMVSIKENKISNNEFPLIPQTFNDKTPGYFRLYPNPVRSGSSLSIEWKETEEGYYQLQLLNQSGQPLHQKEIWIDEKARVLNLDIPFVAAGNYFIVFTSRKSGKKSTEKIVIQ